MCTRLVPYINSNHCNPPPQLKSSLDFFKSLTFKPTQTNSTMGPTKTTTAKTTTKTTKTTTKTVRFKRLMLRKSMIP